MFIAWFRSCILVPLPAFHSFMKHEIDKLKQTISIMVYNITAAEKQIAKYDADAAEMQRARRKKETAKLEKELDKERLKKRRFDETSAENEDQLQSMLKAAKTKLASVSESRDTLVTQILQVLKISDAPTSPRSPRMSSPRGSNNGAGARKRR